MAQKRNENNTYYICDLHFGHANAISFDRCPFENVEEMNEALIRNWNARVTPEDTVYVLGDMFLKYKQSNTAIMAKLNGHKHLIKGNHDWGKVLEEPWESVQPYLEIDDESRRVILCHFPIPFYNRARRGAIMLYGHVHNSAEWELLEKWKQECHAMEIPCNMINVGCMMPYMNYTPRTLDEILAANPVWERKRYD